MDELDLRILGSLAWKPGDPAHMARGILRPWDIARALGIHGNTVKTRLEEMRRDGVLRAVYLYPGSMYEQAAVGVHWLRFGSPGEKREGLRRLAGSLDVNDVHDYVGDTAKVAVVAFVPESLGEAAERVRAHAGAREVALFYMRSKPGDLPGLRVTPLDLRIQRALVFDALRPFPEVAEEVGVTAKTVRARFRAMVQQRGLAIIPHMVLGRMRGLIAFELVLELDDPSRATHAALGKAFPQAFQRSVPQADNAYLFLAVPTTADIEEVLLRAEAVPGVRQARALLVREVFANQGCVLAFFQRALAGQGSDRG